MKNEELIVNNEKYKYFAFNVGKAPVSAQIKSPHAITLIALIITILFSYDEKLKCSNSKGFLLQTL